MVDPKLASCGVCCLVSIVVIIVIIIIGFASLEYTEIGLRQSWWTSSISSSPYEAGRHWIGPGNAFIKFPNTLQTIAFSDDGDRWALKSRTSDGLEVDVECSFQYQLSPRSIFDLYNKFGPLYRDIFVNIATESITAEATHYTAALWFRNFTTIQGFMEARIQLIFNTTAFADVTNFQLTSVGLPSQFESEIRQTEVKRQDILTANSQRDRVRVQQETQVLQATRQAQEININANAEAQATLLNIRGWIEPYQLQQSAQASAYASLYPEFGSSEESFLDYLSMRVARDHSPENAIFSHADL